MNWRQLLLRIVLVSTVTPYGITACVRSPRCESRAVPDFASVVTSSFLLDMLKQMSGLPTLVPVPSGGRSIARGEHEGLRVCPSRVGQPRR
jgi:hypothetical protein